MKYVIGIDVGTGSARAGIFDQSGKMHASAQQDIALHRPHPEWAEQSSTNIWSAICHSVRSCLSQTNISPSDVSGLSFSATCSLVLRDQQDQPLILSEGKDQWDIIVWMDHRATKEANLITSSKSKVLNNLGGTMSPEMQIPKLMWLKKNRPDLWHSMGYAGDLVDFLAYHCTGLTNRSVCTLGCKWTYDPDASQWNHDFLESIGLNDLLLKAQLPETAQAIGSPVGPLKEAAAVDLGLTTQCQVAVGLIDAHAGALGTLGLYAEVDAHQRLALIAGTSNCHIAVSSERCEVPGVWGPYSGAVIDGMWANEGGQSVTGALLDHVVSLFSASQNLSGNPHAAVSNLLLERIKLDLNFAEEVHVLPDFLGNRSPFANPELRGAIKGLTIESPDETFLKVYWAAAASIAYGTRLIIDRLNHNGFEINTIHLSGGHKKSELLVGLYADATNCDVLISKEEEPVLVGAAIAALAQFEKDGSVSRVCKKIAKDVTVRKPDMVSAGLHGKRYQEFLKFYNNENDSSFRESCPKPQIATA